jgi:BolA protein
VCETSRVSLIKTHLETALSPDRLEIIDESHKHIGHAGAASGGGHFTLTIVSSVFTGKSTLERHRLVYQAVEDLMPLEIHALSIKALTPEEDL